MYRGDEESVPVTKTTLSLEGFWNLAHYRNHAIAHVFNAPKETNGTLCSLSKVATTESMINERNMHLIIHGTIIENLNML